jgi:hypothetical protein
MCSVWLSEQTVNFALYTFNRLVFITKVDSVYSAVRTESLYNTDAFRPHRVKTYSYVLTYSIEQSPFWRNEPILN